GHLDPFRRARRPPRRHRLERVRTDRLRDRLRHRVVRSLCPRLPGRDDPGLPRSPVARPAWALDRAAQAIAAARAVDSAIAGALRPARGRPAASIRFADEDERRPGHDRGAGADERDVGVLDLARAGASGGLQRAFNDVPQAVDAAGAEAAAEGVERQLAVELDAAVLDEIERLAFAAEAVGLQAVDHRGGKPVVYLRHGDILRRKPGALPGELGGA